MPVLLPDATPLSTSVPQAVAGLGAAALCTWYCLAKHWIANNLLGLSFAVQVYTHPFLHCGLLTVAGLPKTQQMTLHRPPHNNTPCVGLRNRHSLRSLHFWQMYGCLSTLEGGEFHLKLS